MLLQNPARVEKRCPRLWSEAWADGLLSLAVLIAGICFRADEATANQDTDETEKDATQKEETNKVEAHTDQPKKEPVKAAPDVAPALPGAGVIQLDLVPPGIDPDQQKRMRKLMEQQMAHMRRMMRQNGAPLGGLNGPGMQQQGRLGVFVEKPSETLVEQLDLPKGSGLAVEEVEAGSAAAKAGIKAHDILLEFNGKSVPDDAQEFVKILEGVKPNTPVDAVVLRKGKKETIKGVSLPEAKEVAFPDAPGLRLVPLQPAVNFPNVDLAIPRLDIGNAAFGGGNGVMTTTFRTDDRFTTRHQEGTLIITVTGKVADGKANTNEIQVQDGTESHKYESVEKVPERYRDKVKNLTEMSEKGSVKIEIKK